MLELPSKAESDAVTKVTVNMWELIICVGVWIFFVIHWATSSIPKRKRFECYAGLGIAICLTLQVLGIFGWFKSQLQNKIVDKFQSVQEFNDFLQSKEGDKFLNFVKFNGLAPKEKLLSSLSKGVILVTLGIALILVGQIFTAEMKYFIAFGIVSIALGVGFLISVFISYTLSRKWGIINEKD